MNSTFTDKPSVFEVILTQFGEDINRKMPNMVDTQQEQEDTAEVPNVYNKFMYEWEGRTPERRKDIARWVNWIKQTHIEEYESPIEPLYPKDGLNVREGFSNKSDDEFIIADRSAENAVLAATLAIKTPLSLTDLPRKWCERDLSSVSASAVPKREMGIITAGQEILRELGIFEEQRPLLED